MERASRSEWSTRLGSLAQRTQRAFDRAEALDRRVHQAMIDSEVAMSLAQAREETDASSRLRRSGQD